MIIENRKYFIIFFMTLLFLAFSSALIPKGEKYKLKNSEIRELKDFAFCQCLYQEFGKDSFFVNDGTVDAIVQLGNMGSEHYEFIIKYVENYLDTVKISSYSNNRLGIWKCLQLYHNKSLDSIIKNIKYITKEKTEDE